MQSFRVLVVALMAGAAVPVLAATAHADAGGVPAGTSQAQCVLGCNAQKKACIQTARTDALACKQNCRQNTPPTQLGACMKGCATTFGTAKDTCRTDQKTCIAGCKPSAPVAGSPG